MPWLLIDNSNTRTKFALADATGILETRAWLPTPDITPEALAATLGGLDFHGTLLCSVVPEKARILRDHLAARGPVHPLNYQSDTGLAIDYPHPAQIGADRLANAIGVAARYGAPAIVIDFGTAVTFDVVSAGPAYCGGVIAPGLGAMQDYLGKRTALLPRIEIDEPRAAIGKSTVEAMQAGAVYGYRGLVREIISRLRAEMDGDPVIVATGGDAALIARGLPAIQHVDPDLTLEGIRLAALRNLH
ncbi:type III pantothenate kinase [Luteolibacter flavescens]|uniref:Type III pantothenate kinase n=1 Tax=Luteolibacter flavescens TaxID=1859460 RepID=A0ABT3FQN4_9BACT|nr:type III pantothenate kinase [Luteolibacter flavescens]MCW1885772.1 type III pantothenate kinase [Luteolibacter flavescens]